MSHSHTHVHCHHGHAQGNAGHGRAFAIGIALNVIFIAAEVIYGLKANSLALVADAGHNVSDVLGLVMAWGAARLALSKPTRRYTYGLQSTSILAALGNAVLLLVATGGICWEAMQRFTQAHPVEGETVMAVAALGVAVNGFTAWLFMKGSKDDLNIRGAFLHMLADALVSLGVVISGFVIVQTGWQWLDPGVSIAVSIVIIYGTWGLLRDSFNLTLHAVPAHIDYEQVRDFLASGEEVAEVHDLHIWAMSTTEVALSAHLLMRSGHPGDRFLKELARALDERFGIRHSTVQIELGDGAGECVLSAHDAA